MKTDSLFYRLMQAQPTLAFELAGLTVPEPSRYGFISQEVKQTAFRLDGIAEPPKDRPDAPRGYVEVQFQPDEGFYLRFFSEIFLHLRQYPSSKHWQAVVLYPDASVERLAPSAEPLLILPNLHRIYLDQLPLLQSENPRHWLIGLILAEVKNLSPIVDTIKDHGIRHRTDKVDWLDFLETVLVYKLPNFTREEILKMLEFSDINIEETRYYQDAMAKGEKKGEAKLLLRLLERKFRPLPDTARQRVAEADAETLLVWGERMLDANSLDEVLGY
ncbi:MAG: Rpn family recombination-promoting nuclease/putative transposase [Candidatus Methylumidiphilus sp.]